LNRLRAVTYRFGPPNILANDPKRGGQILGMCGMGRRNFSTPPAAPLLWDGVME
jgi:hypothetical protein